MSRQETLDLLLNTVIETMTDLYSRAGISEQDKETYMQQGNESFKVIAINIYEKLTENGIIAND
jgi:hypothetical protein